MIVRIRIEYLEKKEEYKGKANIEHQFVYDSEKYKEELIEEVTKIINEYPELIGFSVSI